MTKLISDLQTKLSRRLGSNTVTTDSSELSKRRDWFWEAISTVCSDDYMWFMKVYGTDTSVTNKPYYAIPTRFRHPITVKVDGIIYTKTTKEEFERVHSSYNRIVSLPQVSIVYEYYIYDDNFYFSPGLTTPTSYSVSLTSSSTAVSATTTSAHGFSAGQYVTIAGANESAYNGAFEILTAPTTTTFTYTALSTPSATPATGTITATLKNIEYWYYEEATEPSTDASGIVIPDKYDYIPVAYAEGRYWSAAHKRGKAADGFTEFESGLAKIKMENFRRKFGQEA